MTKIPGKRADWMATSNTTSNISLSISPSTKLPEQELLYFALCNLSPYNPYCTSDPLDFGPPPARRLRKPPPPSFRAWCNLTPANPYDLPTMRPTLAQRIQGHHGVTTWQQKPDYKTYKSPYGPDYKVRPNFHGIALNRAIKFGITAGSFGVVGLVFALQFFADVPKVRTDIMQKLPLIGDYFIRDLPPSDNPF